MGRGCGILMRKIVQELEGSEKKVLTRAALEDALCPLGFRSDNILRAIRTLDSIHVAAYREGRFAETSTVHLYVPVPLEEAWSDDQIYALLAGMQD